LGMKSVVYRVIVKNDKAQVRFTIRLF